MKTLPILVFGTCTCALFNLRASCPNESFYHLLPHILVVVIDGFIATSEVVAEAAFGINSASIPKAIAIIIASAIFLCDFFMISAIKLFLWLFSRKCAIRLQYCYNLLASRPP